MKLDYCSVEELASAAKSCGKTIGQIVLEEQAESMELTVREVFEKMSSEFQVMKQSVTDGLKCIPLSCRDAATLVLYSEMPWPWLLLWLNPTPVWDRL